MGVRLPSLQRNGSQGTKVWGGERKPADPADKGPSTSRGSKADVKERRTGGQL